MKSLAISGLRSPIIIVLHVCILASIAQVTRAQSGTESASPSYNESWREFRPGSGTKAADPNVYAYTAEFAKRFQMPAEWIFGELTGADAVAFRVVPSPYKTCGWGGDPKACRTDEVRCEMDLYFDHKRNPLPWDERFPELWTDRYGTSVHFIPAPIRELRLPKRSNDHFFTKYMPFIDQNTGKGLMWGGGYKESEEDRGGIYMSLTSYDREIFPGIAFLSITGGCGKPADFLWLSAENSDYKTKDQSFKLVALPQSWRVRVKHALSDSDQRAEAFFKREGEKAIKALHKSPATVIPPISTGPKSRTVMQPWRDAALG